MQFRCPGKSILGCKNAQEISRFSLGNANSLRSKSAKADSHIMSSVAPASHAFQKFVNFLHLHDQYFLEHCLPTRLLCKHVMLLLLGAGQLVVWQSIREDLGIFVPEEERYERVGSRQERIKEIEQGIDNEEAALPEEFGLNRDRIGWNQWKSISYKSVKQVFSW